MLVAQGDQHRAPSLTLGLHFDLGYRIIQLQGDELLIVCSICCSNTANYFESALDLQQYLM